MEIGPLEYVVIGFQEHHFTDDILPALNAIQQTGDVRVVEQRNNSVRSASTTPRTLPF